MTIQQLSGIDTVVSDEKYNAYGTVKSRIANAYNRLPLEIQKLQFNQVLQEKLEDESEGIGRPRKKKTQKKQAKAKKKEARKERRKDDKGLRALRLFMPLMRRKLKKKGVKISDPKSIREVATKFKAHIMEKKPIRGLDNDDVIGVIPPGSGKAAVEAGKEAIGLSTNIIKKIIDFIKGAVKKIKDRKKKGGKLTKEQEQDIAETEAVEKEIGTDGGMALPLIAAGAAAFFLLKK